MDHRDLPQANEDEELEIEIDGNEDGEVLDDRILETLGIDMGGGGDLSCFSNLIEMSEKLRNRRIYLHETGY